jgi:hypothetical protein
MPEFRLFDGVLLKDLREAATEARRGEVDNVQLVLPRAIDAAKEVRRLLDEALDDHAQLGKPDVVALIIEARNLI